MRPSLNLAEDASHGWFFIRRDNGTSIMKYEIFLTNKGW